VHGRAGHAQVKMTRGDIHAAQVAFRGAAEPAEDMVFFGVPPGFAARLRHDPERGGSPHEHRCPVQPDERHD